MKGVVFTMFGELVEEQFGFDVWDELIEVTEPPSKGIYIATDVYPDEELLAYVAALSARAGVPSNQLVYAFGEYMLGRFKDSHPEFFSGHDLSSFLQSVHQVIHVEVKKLHADAVLPTFTYEDNGPQELVMIYQSPRKLCALAEGLISASATHFGQQLSCQHETCMHDGASHCRLKLSFG
ncbi:MAG: heme NO-binding domain-containing protein [Pseudomonadota bacterium]